MNYPFVSIGYGSVVSVDKIVAVIGFGSQPSKRLKDEAQKKGKLVDATEGRKTRSLVVTSSDHVILSALACETIAFRLGQKSAGFYPNSGEGESAAAGIEKKRRSI
jgi:regulator of extracellular matrix RemA (YlzA/DUF370 family)